MDIVVASMEEPYKNNQSRDPAVAGNIIQTY
jgi:hypothetical protein